MRLSATVDTRGYQGLPGITRGYMSGAKAEMLSQHEHIAIRKEYTTKGDYYYYYYQGLRGITRGYLALHKERWSPSEAKMHKVDLK